MTRRLIDTFYTGLAERDGDAMAACYRDDVVFEDPAFGVLIGENARDMWRMLCSSDTDLTVTHDIVESTPTTATTNWVARYTFPTTGRAVRNDVTATMVIEDGKIIDHRDRFSFWTWSSQALGTPGRLLGWSPVIKAKVRTTTTSRLQAFQAERRS